MNKEIDARLVGIMSELDKRGDVEMAHRINCVAFDLIDDAVRIGRQLKSIRDKASSPGYYTAVNVDVVNGLNDLIMAITGEEQKPLTLEGDCSGYCTPLGSATPADPTLDNLQRQIFTIIADAVNSGDAGKTHEWLQVYNVLTGIHGELLNGSD